MAATKIQLEIVTPARKVLSQQVDEVRAPAADGGFGVKPGHTAFVARMKAGRLDAVTGGSVETFVVGEGFVQVAGDRVLVLAERCDRAEDIDLAKAQAEVDAETKKLLGMPSEGADYEVQRARVENAAARVLVASRK